MKTVQACSGARVQFCNHQGWFVADIRVVGTSYVVVANGPVTPDNINRGQMEMATHVVRDWPEPCVWKPERGFFVVPSGQIQVLEGTYK